MAKRIRITGPGLVYNRNPRKKELQLIFDPSPDSFVTQSRLDCVPMTVTISAEGIKPIALVCRPTQWLFKVANPSFDKTRLADLELLLTEEIPVHVTCEYTPEKKLFDQKGEENDSGSA